MSENTIKTGVEANKMVSLNNTPTDREETLRRTAIHEIGHVLSLFVTGGFVDMIQYIEINEDGEGFTSVSRETAKSNLPFPDQVNYNPTRLFQEVCFAVGGGVFESLYYPDSDVCDYEDITIITQYLQWGYDYTDNEVQTILQTCRLMLIQALKKYTTHSNTQALIKRLIRQRKLTIQEITNYIG